MTTDELINALREYADFHRVGDVWWRTLTEAADRLEELDERIAIMSEPKCGDDACDIVFDGEGGE